jgi:hypothetical protein
LSSQPGINLQVNTNHLWQVFKIGANLRHDFVELRRNIWYTISFRHGSTSEAHRSNKYYFVWRWWIIVPCICGSHLHLSIQWSNNFCGSSDGIPFSAPRHHLQQYLAVFASRHETNRSLWLPRLVNNVYAASARIDKMESYTSASNISRLHGMFLA